MGTKDFPYNYYYIVGYNESIATIINTKVLSRICKLSYLYWLPGYVLLLLTIYERCFMNDTSNVLEVVNVEGF